MAAPYLNNRKNWTTYTLEPNSSLGVILSVDSGGTPSTTDETYWDGEIPWLTPKEITRIDSIYISDTERKINELGVKNSSAKVLPADTVLLTKRAPVGAVVINAIPMSTNQGFLNFRCGPKLRPKYLAYWFRANKRYCEAIANGSTYPELYKGDLFEFEISVPPIDEQDLIVEFLNSLQFQIHLSKPLEQSTSQFSDVIELQRQNERLAKLRDIIQPLVLSGELDILQIQPSAVDTHTANASLPNR